MKARKAEYFGPVRVNKLCWYYEERKGICVVQEVRDDRGALLGVAMTTIPWAKIEASVRRHKVK